MLKQASATKFKQTLGLKGLRASGVFASGPPLGFCPGCTEGLTALLRPQAAFNRTSN